MNKSQNYKSCFITDVQITTDQILLSDNLHNVYILKTSNTEGVNQFKIWFKEIFSKGIAQTCTIFQYELIPISECEIETVIIKFILNIKK